MLGPAFTCSRAPPRQLLTACKASGSGSRISLRSSANNTVVEQRVVDVVVIGGSALAVAAAYSLAKSGKKVKDTHHYQP